MRLLTWSGCRHVIRGTRTACPGAACTGVTRRAKTVLGRTNSAMWLVLSALLMDFRDAEARKSARQVSVQTPPDAALELPFAFDGPPPPVPPAMITRDEDGRATIRAVRLTSPLRLDGRLDESDLHEHPADVRLHPDRAARRARRPPRRPRSGWRSIAITSTSRSAAGRASRSGWSPTRCGATASNIYQNDYVGFIFDTFYDRRNGVQFAVNPIGGRSRRADHQRAAVQRRLESGLGCRGRPVRRRLDGRSGDPVQVAALPARAARRSGASTSSGNNRWKNEISFLDAHAGRVRQARGIMQISLAATLVGLEAPPGSKNLEIKPYVIVDLTTDLHARRRGSRTISAATSAST